jgi:hypothetical protein
LDYFPRPNAADFNLSEWTIRMYFKVF